MAIKYYSDGTYTKGDGKLYVSGIGVVGNDKSTTVSKAESGTSTPTSSSKTGSTLTTMRGTGSGSSSKSYADTLKQNITNSVNNPSNGVYNSLSNNSMIKDMETAYKTSGGNKTDNSIEAYLSQNGVNANERYEPNFGDMGDELKYNPYQDLERLQAYYEQQEELLRERNRQAVQQGTNRLNAQKSNISQAADENARQAYIQYMQSQKALPQQLASQGVSGGATETANLGLQTAYQNNVNAINQNKANRLQEIDNAIVDLQNTGDLSTVEQVLANNQAALDAYMNTFDKGVSYNKWANEYNAGRIDATRDYEAEQLQAYLDAWEEQNKLLSDEKKEERDNVLKLYTGGYMSRDDAAARLGYDPEILYDTMGYLTKENELALKDKQMDINNTQSLINDRNSGGGSGGTKATSASTINSIINTANKMLNEREDVFGDGSIYRNLYDDNAVKAYILSQNITDEEQYNILSNLGLI